MIYYSTSRTRSVDDKNKFRLFQFGSFNGAEVWEKVESNNVTLEEASAPRTSRGQDGDRRHLTIVTNLDAEIVVEFVIRYLHGRCFRATIISIG